MMKQIPYGITDCEASSDADLCIADQTTRQTVQHDLRHNRPLT